MIICNWFDWHISGQSTQIIMHQLCWLGIKQTVYLACSFSQVFYMLVLNPVWWHSWPQSDITPFSCSVNWACLFSQQRCMIFIYWAWWYRGTIQTELCMSQWVSNFIHTHTQGKNRLHTNCLSIACSKCGYRFLGVSLIQHFHRLWKNGSTSSNTKVRSDMWLYCMASVENNFADSMKMEWVSLSILMILVSWESLLLIIM